MRVIKAALVERLVDEITLHEEGNPSQAVKALTLCVEDFNRLHQLPKITITKNTIRFNYFALREENIDGAKLDLIVRLPVDKFLTGFNDEELEKLIFFELGIRANIKDPYTCKKPDGYVLDYIRNLYAVEKGLTDSVRHFNELITTLKESAKLLLCGKGDVEMTDLIDMFSEEGVSDVSA